MTGLSLLFWLWLLLGLQEAASIVASSKNYIFFIYFIYGFNISNSGSGQPLYSSSSSLA